MHKIENNLISQTALPKNVYIFVGYKYSSIHAHSDQPFFSVTVAHCLRVYCILYCIVLFPTIDDVVVVCLYLLWIPQSAVVHIEHI